MELIHQMEHYKAVYHQWEQLDAGARSASATPSVPDFAAAAHYGEMLGTPPSASPAASSLATTTREKSSRSGHRLCHQIPPACWPEGVPASLASAQ